jgi:hypothetical protein
MKAKHPFTLFFVLGLIIAIAGFVSTAMGQDAAKGNRGNIERSSQKDVGAITAESSTEQPDERGAAPQAPAAGGTHIVGTCYSSPLVIPAAAFSADGFLPNSFFFDFTGGYITGTAASYGCVMAPVNLPNGATIDRICATIYDNSSSHLQLNLWRVHYSTGATTLMATVETTGTSTNVYTECDSSVLEPLVDYPTYAYYVTTCLADEERIYSIRIYYNPS